MRLPLSIDALMSPLMSPLMPPLINVSTPGLPRSFPIAFAVEILALHLRPIGYYRTDAFHRCLWAVPYRAISCFIMFYHAISVFPREYAAWPSAVNDAFLAALDPSKLLRASASRPVWTMSRRSSRLGREESEKKAV